MSLCSSLVARCSDRTGVAWAALVGLASGLGAQPVVPPPPPPPPAAALQTPASAPAQTQAALSASAQALLTEAEDLMQRGRTDEARSRWQQVVAAHAKTPQAATALLRLAQTETDLHAALRLLDQLRTDHPTSAEVEPALAMEGEIYHLLGDYANAAQIYRLYLSSHPQGSAAAVARERLITSLIEIGQAQQALAAWDQAAGADPTLRDDPAALMQRADALIALMRWEEAVAVLRDIIARFPNREPAGRAHLAAGLCLEALSRWDEAAPIYQALMRLRPQSAEARLAGERLAAIQRLEMVLSEFPAP